MRLLIPATLLLAGCATLPPEPAVAGPGTCSTEGLARFNGQPANVDVAGEMRRAAGARAVRWTGPGLAQTMDYRSDRLNIQLNEGLNTVVGANCG